MNLTIAKRSKLDERMLILIDIEKLMTSRDMQLMDEVALA